MQDFRAEKPGKFSTSCCQVTQTVAVGTTFVVREHGRAVVDG
jgi:hypothetical protein